MKKFFNIKIIAVLCVVTYLTISLISAQFDLMTKRQQLEILEEQQKRIELETQDIQRVLEIEDEAEYVERVAREKLGYANPNETVYKDIQGEE
ncbi:MAG: septum formation initiator family protein [Oscillospiraceae bacterium]|nr:septum formation initiator family protein [Oscillospiraceae bacterium]MBR2503582.1 septum formation initiator family protein [Oscillospiraceae bacterium]